MDSGVIGLGAVVWTDAWNGAGPEPGLRLSVDPARLLELLRGVPASRALLSDLQRAVSTGRLVELIVSLDREIAEISTGSGHYVLTVAARNTVLAALIGQPQVEAMSTNPPPAPGGGQESSTPDSAAWSRARPVPGILWESPSAVNRHAVPTESIALPWIGPDAYLRVGRDGAGGGSSPEEGSGVTCATLHLQLPQLGAFEAHIRLCGSAVAVSIDCPGAAGIEAQLELLEQRLSARGLVSAHVGLVPARSPR
jgi:hypothetical protein